MNKLVVGSVVGAALIFAAYKLKKGGELEIIGDRVNRFAGRTRRNFKNAMASFENQTEYLKGRARYEMNKMQKRKEKLSHLTDKVAK